MAEVASMEAAPQRETAHGTAPALCVAEEPKSYLVKAA
jgi:hypothetical protein